MRRSDVSGHYAAQIDRERCAMGISKMYLSDFGFQVAVLHDAGVPWGFEPRIITNAFVLRSGGKAINR